TVTKDTDDALSWQLNKCIFYTADNDLSGGPSKIIRLDMFNDNMLFRFTEEPYKHIKLLHSLVRLWSFIYHDRRHPDDIVHPPLLI
ncbi:hypothetical protein MTO96_035975, partial [Rhipicephalus appendiculatus]